MSVCTLRPLHTSHGLSGVLVFIGSEDQQILYGRFLVFSSSLHFIIELADTDKHQNDFVLKEKKKGGWRESRLVVHLEFQ